MKRLEIASVTGREILDSRGNPTVEAEVHLTDGTMGRGTAPSGASTGEFEALELRDHDLDRFGGKGVLKAAEHIRTDIHAILRGMDPCNIYEVDHAMIKADGTADRSKLGANAILAVSMCSGSGQCPGTSAVPFSGRRQCGLHAASHDEYYKRRSPCGKYG